MNEGDLLICSTLLERYKYVALQQSLRNQLLLLFLKDSKISINHG